MVGRTIHNQKNVNAHKHNFILALTALTVSIPNILITIKWNALVVPRIRSMISSSRNVLTVHLKSQNLMDKSVCLANKILIGISLFKHVLNVVLEGFIMQHQDFVNVQIINFSLVLNVWIASYPNILIFRKCNAFHVPGIKLMI